MPDLGKYAFEVTLAYGGSLAIIAALVVVSFWQSRRARISLADAEDRAKNG